ncbi:MAG: ABC transporter ATP-binding protein [Hyphomicrobiales bacterium]|nr:ABC transporter ATP-binding protein [Hyphomicrobiales bacterium]
MQVRKGEIVGLIGPNGAGKSTLFNAIAGVRKPTEGSIYFEGRDVTDLGAPQRCALGVARTFQVVKSFETMRVVENVMVGAFVRTASAAVAREKARATLDFVGLRGRENAMAGELTPPEKRRLEVARALATEPKLVLLDEAMTGLTPAEARQGVDLVRAIRDRGMTVVMVEHVMEIVMPLIDRAVVLDLGRVIAEGPPKEIVRDERVITAYLGERHRARSA